MSPAIRWLTVGLWLLPPGLGLAGLVTGRPWAVVAFLVLTSLYGAVWIGCRPAGFRVTPAGLEVAFPAWTRSIPAASLAGARVLSSGDFHREFGVALRIGVGGLWGGFGWLWTRRRGLVEFYVSREDGLLLVERRDGRPLLLTPDDPWGMAERLAALAGGG